MDEFENSLTDSIGLNFLESVGSSELYKTLKEVFKSAFITNCSLDEASITEEEIKTLEELDHNEIVDNIKNLLDGLLNFKSNYRAGKTGELATRCDQLEKLLQKQEAEVRNHIKIEHQLKLHIENMQNKINDLEKNLLEAQDNVKDMEAKGLETMQTKLQKIENRFQSELCKVLKVYREENLNDGKNFEKVKKLEEMYEKKEKAFVKLQQDHIKLKQKLEDAIQTTEKLKKQLKKHRTGSISNDIYKLRKNSLNEDQNKPLVMNSKESARQNTKYKNLDNQFYFKSFNSVNENNPVEPLSAHIDLKLNPISKNINSSSKKHIRSSSDNYRSLSSKKLKLKR
jgi:hypothetical protein